MTFNQYYVTGPEKLWAAIVAAARARDRLLPPDPARRAPRPARPPPQASTPDPTTKEPPEPDRTGDTPVVHLEGVDKVFARGDQSGTTGARRASTSTSRRGEFVSLIGPSGCGKSTLLRDHRRPHRSRPAGEVLVNGKPAAQARRDRDYGMVFQAPVLFDWRTVEDNVKLPLEVLGNDARRRDRSGRRRCSSWSTWATSPGTCRTSCRAACSSGSRSPGRSRSSPGSCSWTSRSGRSTR